MFYKNSSLEQIRKKFLANCRNKKLIMEKGIYISKDVFMHTGNFL